MLGQPDPRRLSYHVAAATRSYTIASSKVEIFLGPRDTMLTVNASHGTTPQKLRARAWGTRIEDLELLSS